MKNRTYRQTLIDLRTGDPVEALDAVLLELGAIRGIPTDELGLPLEWYRMGGEYRLPVNPDAVVGFFSLRWSTRSWEAGLWNLRVGSFVAPPPLFEPDPLATFGDGVTAIEAWRAEHLS